MTTLAAQSELVTKIGQEHAKVEARFQWEAARLVALAVRAEWPTATGVHVDQEWDDDGDGYIALGKVVDSTGDILFDPVEACWAQGGGPAWGEAINGSYSLSFGYGSDWTAHAPQVDEGDKRNTERVLDIAAMIGAAPLP